MTVHRYYRVPEDLGPPANMRAAVRRQLIATVQAAIRHAVRNTAPGEAVQPLPATGAAPAPRERIGQTNQPDQPHDSYAIPSYGDDGEKVGLPVLPSAPAETEPTYGNMPRDPSGYARGKGPRVALKVIDGKWREVSPAGWPYRTPTGYKSAGGDYKFVVQDGTIYAVKPKLMPGGRVSGHTEAAEGGRVTWAGSLRVDRKTGQVTYWDNGSGHYRPLAMFRQTAIDAGLPEGAWHPNPETLVRPHTKDNLPQLPVAQPRTKSRTGGPAKVPPGPPRSVAPPSQPPPPPTATATATPSVPPTGDKVVGRVSFTYDTKAEGEARLRLRGIDLHDYPPDRQGAVTRFFRDKPLLKGLSTVGATEAANFISGAVMTKVEGHFLAAVKSARAELATHFPTGRQLLLDHQIADLAQAADDVLHGRSYTLHRPLEENLADLVTYLDALTEAIAATERYEAAAAQVAGDLRQRALVLREAALSVEKAFAWIHQHLPVLFAYYQSFILWRVRELFLNLGDQLDGLATHLEIRTTGYETAFANLNTRLAAFEDEAGDPRNYAADLVERSARRRSSP